MDKIQQILRLILRLPIMLAWTLFMLFLCMGVINSRLRSVVERMYFKGMLILLGVKVRLNKKIREKGVVIVANHVSYIDIMIMHALFQGYFVAKAEVKNWPIYGWGASLIRSVFVERGKNGTMASLIKEGTERLQMGHNMIIFAEGTTSDKPMAPFKKGAFLLAKENNAPIIPVIIKYENIDRVCWIGEMTFLDHLIKFLATSKRDEVSVTVLPKVHSLYFDNENELLCTVRSGMQRVYDDDSLQSKNLEDINLFGLNNSEEDEYEIVYSS